MEEHQVGYVWKEYLQCKTGLPLHVRMGKLDFTCRGLGKRACENGKVGFCMSGFGKASMLEWKSWILHARVWKSVHVRMGKLDFACKGLKKRTCENRKEEIACREKERRTREKEKMRNCVSGKRGGGHAKKRK